MAQDVENKKSGAEAPQGSLEINSKKVKWFFMEISSPFLNPEGPLEYLFQNINHPYLNFGMFMAHGLVQ